MSFQELPLYNGVGPVHVNRFRTRIRPGRGQAMPSGIDLANNMRTFMDPRTAAVGIDNGREWHGRPTLVFRGVARVRPFILLTQIPIPIPLPAGWDAIGVPQTVRDWMMPDIHTDTVGFPDYLSDHAFTVQTLKRLFESGEDATIRTLIVRVVAPMVVGALAGVIGEFITRPLVRRYISEPLANYAIDINRHHFLAGRRSFRMGTAQEFGLQGNEWIFETAAVEAYSHPVFQHTTDIVMGGSNATVTPVWVQMGARVASSYGTQVGSVEVANSNVGSPSNLAADPLYRSISQRHSALLP